MKRALVAGVAAFALLFSLGTAPAQAQYGTTAQNLGAQAIVVQTMSGAVKTLTTGQSVRDARSFALTVFQCATDNGVKKCNNTINGTVWFTLGSGYHALKRVGIVG